MQNIYARSALLAALLASFAAGGYYYMTHRAPQVSTKTNTVITVDPNATSTIAEGYTIERIDESNTPAPDYKKAIPFSSSVAADVRIAIQTQVSNIRKQLDANPSNYEAWMQLAILHKIAGDPAGTIDIWLYVAAIWPKDAAVHRNLGDLYYSQGAKTKGRAEYNIALTNARAAGDATYTAQLEREIEALK